MNFTVKFTTYVLVALVSATTSAVALKWSDKNKVDVATHAIAMADVLATRTPDTISCRINMANGQRGDANVEVALQSGQQAFTNLLSAMTTKINNDRDTANAYLASIGVTND